MTHEADVARMVAVDFEAKKDGLKQVQSGDVKVTFTVSADDMPSSLYSDVMGQRYKVVIVALNDDETPRQTPKTKSYAGQAKMMIQEDAFCDYAAMCMGMPTPLRQRETESWLKFRCDVKSCSELIEGTDVGKKFKRLQADYLRWRDGYAENE